MVAGTSQVNLHHVIGSLRSVERSETKAGALLSVWPFITISRQAGAGGHVLGTLLAERLNRFESTGPRLRSLPHKPEDIAHPWQCLDRELVERIAKDHHLSSSLIKSMEYASHTWISEFLTGVSLNDNQPSELAVFRRIVQTMRALAHAGNVILIGLGSIHMTHDMPSGIHIRLVAPLDYRVEATAQREKIALARARSLVHDMDDARNSYFHRYWPNRHLSAELFHLTLNSGMMHEEQMVDCVLPLLKPLPHAPV